MQCLFRSRRTHTAIHHVLQRRERQEQARWGNIFRIYEAISASDPLIFGWYCAIISRKSWLSIFYADVPRWMLRPRAISWRSGFINFAPQMIFVRGCNRLPDSTSWGNSVTLLIESVASSDLIIIHSIYYTSLNKFYLNNLIKKEKLYFWCNLNSPEYSIY